jgi:hypothetical protein
MCCPPAQPANAFFVPTKKGDGHGKANAKQIKKYFLF